MKLTTTKQLNENVFNYILSAIDGEGYGKNLQTDAEKLTFLAETFKAGETTPKLSIAKFLKPTKKAGEPSLKRKSPCCEFTKSIAPQTELLSVPLPFAALREEESGKTL